MTLRLIQFLNDNGERRVAAAAGDRVHAVPGVDSVYALAREAGLAGNTLAAHVEGLGAGEPVDIAAALAEGRVLAPIDHPDPAHMLVTGTGLTHLGSAEGRDKMHRDAATAMTDSMRMFLLGMEGGKPAPGETGAQPEWFYKGDGSTIVPTGQALRSPAFALDGGEEPEIAGIYLIGEDRTPLRLGFALANEFSDHITERGNYLWLAHSKLRPAALGPELLTGELPSHVEGVSRILRNGNAIWERPFLSGESNMSHSIANLEAHHFKYDLFRRPGDIHVHFFGTATLSFSEGIATREGDIFEIEAAPFAWPLRNPLAIDAPVPVAVTAL